MLDYERGRPLAMAADSQAGAEFPNRTLVMGVVNVTPDSFSDGSGGPPNLKAAVLRGLQLAAEGADIIDVGGESSRPGAEPVPLNEELRRVVPVVQEVAARVKVPVSVDTVKSEVARRAIEAGARMINDISALRFDPEMAPLAAEAKVPVVLMHMLGTPQDMQDDPFYLNLIPEVYEFLEDRIGSARVSGIAKERLVVDPGLGFGKTKEHNLELLYSLSRFRELDVPILVGPSRKSFIGKVLDLEVNDRLEGTSACVAAAILCGARLVRVHDVKPIVRVARMCDAILEAGRPPNKLSRT